MQPWMATFYIHRVGFGHGPQAKSRRWFLEQALDKVALTAGGGPRRSTGWAYGGYPQRARGDLAIAAGRGLQVNSRKFLLMSVTCLWSALPTATNVGGPTRCAPSTIVLSGPSPTCE